MDLEMTALLALEAQRWIEAIETNPDRALNDLSAKAAGFDNFSHMTRLPGGRHVTPLEMRGTFEVSYRRVSGQDPHVVVRFDRVFDGMSGNEFTATYFIRLCGQEIVVDV